MVDGPIDRFNDDQVRALIARALEFEARGRATTADELREIAIEIGIAPEAVEAALQEHRRRSELGPVAVHSRVGLVVTAVGLPLGAAAGGLLSVSGPVIGLGILGLKAAGLLATGALIATLGKQPTHRSFQLRNLLLWAGVGVGGLLSAALMGGGPVALTGIIVSWSIRGWITSSVLGSAAVVAIRRIARPPDSTPSSPTPDTPSATGRLRAIGRRIVEWYDRHISRERSNVVIRNGAMHSAIAQIVRSRLFLHNVCGEADARAVHMPSSWQQLV